MDDQEKTVILPEDQDRTMLLPEDQRPDQLDLTGSIDITAFNLLDTGSILARTAESLDSFNIFRSREDVESRLGITRFIDSEQIEICNHSTQTLPRISGQYEILKDFAEGGLGKILTAKDRILNRHVAIKSLKEEFRSQPQVVEDFVAEAEVTAQLDHPSIIPLYGLGTDDDGGLFQAMKLVNGRTARQYIGDIIRHYQTDGVKTFDEKHSLVTRLEHFLRACDAVSYAHSKRVLHRDLKPDNIMVGEFREVYVMDWGIACLADEDGISVESPLTNEHGQILVPGTPRYMAPELITGNPASIRSDVFALGMILFELTTLQKPVTAASVQEALYLISSGRFEPVKHRFSEVQIPDDLKAIIEKSTSPDPGDRYGTVGEFTEDIRRFLLNEEVSCRPDNWFRSTTRWIENHMKAALIIVIVTVLSLAAFSLYSLQQRNRLETLARHRELRLTSLQTRMARQAYLIDRHFLHLEDMLNNFAEKAGYMLKNQVRDKGDKLYCYLDLKSLKTAPGDLTYAPLYRRKVSLGHPVYKLPPGMSFEQAKPELECLINLRPDFRRILLSSIPGTELTKQNEQHLEKVALEQGLPLRWVYVGLSDGVFMSYPGKDVYPMDYDPRKRPWYRQSVGKRGTIWGNPYIDIAGQGLMLACTKPFYSESGDLMGIAGLDVTFDYVIKMLAAEDKDDSAVLERYIVDEHGHIVISSQYAGQVYEAGVMHNETMQLPTFHQKAVLREIQKGKEGFYETKAGSRHLLYAYTKIHTINWHYIEQIDLDKLLAE